MNEGMMNDLLYVRCCTEKSSKLHIFIIVHQCLNLSFRTDIRKVHEGRGMKKKHVKIDKFRIVK